MKKPFHVVIEIIERIKEQRNIKSNLFFSFYDLGNKSYISIKSKELKSKVYIPYSLIVAYNDIIQREPFGTLFIDNTSIVE